MVATRVHYLCGKLLFGESSPVQVHRPLQAHWIIVALPACLPFGAAVLILCLRTKVDGKTNHQKRKLSPELGPARTQPLLLGWKNWKASLGHLEMLMRLANSRWPGLARVELSV